MGISDAIFCVMTPLELEAGVKGPFVTWKRFTGHDFL